MSSGKPTGGFGSVVTIVVSLLIAFLLMVFYLREFVASGPKGATKATAVDAARKQAKAFEEQQQRRLDEANEVGR